MPYPKAALAIDGGGVRGLVPARLLCEIERRTGRPISRLFSLIAGSSIGGILALTLVKPGSDGTPAHTAEEGASLLGRSLGSVFTPRWWHKLPVVGFVAAMARPKYSSAGAEALLRDHFGSARMGDALTAVAIGAYDIGAGEPRLFRSGEGDRGLLMYDVALATSAAPGFFRPASIEDGGTSSTYVDGALFSNNAGMVAYSELLRRGIDQDDMLIVSLGAGRSRCRLDPERAAKWGFFHWGPNIVRTALDGSSRMIDLSLERMLPDVEGGRRFFRIDAGIAPALESIDDVSSQNMQAVSDFGDEVVQTHAAEIDELCAQLGDRAD